MAELKKSDSGAKEASLSEGSIEPSAQIAGDAKHVFKSFGMRLYDNNKAYCANLIVKGDALPARATFSDWMKKHGWPSTLILGTSGEMVDELPITVLENVLQEEIVPAEECDEPYEVPVFFDEPILDKTLIDVEFELGEDRELKLTLIEAETGKRHAMHLKRKSGSEPADSTLSGF